MMKLVNAIFISSLCLSSASLSADEFHSIHEDNSTCLQNFFKDQATLFVWNVAVSLTSFFVINMALYRQCSNTILALSAIEVSKNIINYALLENKGNWLLSAIFYYPFNVAKERLKLLPVSVVLATIAEVLKAGSNFEVTEKWFPIQWSEPPENPQYKVKAS